MKRLLLLLPSLLVSIVLTAQTSTQVDFNRLGKRIERSNTEIQDPKKNLKPRAWSNRGNLMLEVFEASILDARIGMGIIDFNIIVGKPKQQTDETNANGEKVSKLVFDRVTFTFVNDVLASWEITSPIVEKPLDIALEAYRKALELDPREKNQRTLNPSLVRLKFRFIDEGSNCFELKNFQCALHNFARSVDVGQLPAVNQLDTIVVYYTGLSAQLAGEYEVAVEYYKRAIGLDYTSDGNLYYNIFESYSAMGKDSVGLMYLETGLTRYPTNQSILYALINYYLSKGDDPTKVLDFIQIAKSREPDNVSLYHAEGTLQDKLGNTEAARKAYEAALEINPNFFDATFNLGVLYFNAGVRLLEEANKIPAKELARYDEVMAQANAEFKKSIPYMERCLEINPKDKATLETLKNLYFRFRYESPEMAAKLEKVNEILNEL